MPNTGEFASPIVQIFSHARTVQEMANASVASTLNPNAPLFIPSSFQVITEVMPEWNVEDFSPEWWNLVQTSPEFCEFWMREYEGSETDDLFFFLENEEIEDAIVELDVFGDESVDVV